MREKSDKTKKEVAKKRTAKTNTKAASKKTTTTRTTKATKTTRTTKATKTTKTSKTKNTNKDVENLKKEFEEVQKQKEIIKENKGKEEIKEEIKQEEEIKKTNIEEDKLDKINEEANTQKTKRKGNSKIEKKYYCLFYNTATAIFYIMYFLLFMFGTYEIPAMSLPNCIKGLTLFDLIVSIVLFEIAYKKDNSYIFVIGIETAFLGGITMFLLNLFYNSNMYFGIWIAVIIGIILGYYTIKTVGMWLKRRKE